MSANGSALAEHTIWTPGRAGWQGQQGSLAGLVVIGVILGLFFVGYAAILFSDPAPSMKLMAVAVVLTLGLGIWLLALHMRVGRVRVVRVVAESTRLTFGRARATRLPTALLAVAGAALLATWLWSLFSVPAGRLPMLSLLLTPVCALCLIYGGVRAFFDSGSRLVLEPEGIRLRIPRTGLTATWDEVLGASLEGNSVVVRAVTPRPSSWAARDFASDPVVLAELITFYARTPAARAEIGEATLARLRSGDF